MLQVMPGKKKIISMSEFLAMKRLKISLILAVLFGLIGVFLINFHIKNSQNKLNTAYNPTEVVVANTNIEKNSHLKKEAISTQIIPKNLALKNMLKPDAIDYLVGHKILKDIEKGDPILLNYVEDFDNSLSSDNSIELQRRWVPIKENDIEASKIIFKNGHRVDILLTYEDAKDSSETKTILQNIEIRKPEINDTLDLLPGLKEESYSFLVMTPKESEIFVHAKNKGKLNFVTRNPKDKKKKFITGINDKTFSRLTSNNGNIEIISSAF